MPRSLLVGLSSVAGATYVTAAQNAARRARRAVAQDPPYVTAARYRVSLVVPAYNEVDYIGNLLSSGLHQTEPLGEMVVASSSPPEEGTNALASSLGARVVPCQYGNIAASRNQGAQSCDAPEILVFADADMCLSHQCIEKMVSALERGYALVHPRLAIADSVFWNVALYGGQLLRPPWWTTGCVAVWADAFWDVGGYDESFNPIQDHTSREDMQLGRRIIDAFGPSSVKLIGFHAATSARRYQAQGGMGLREFDVPVRQRT